MQKTCIHGATTVKDGIRRLTQAVLTIRLWPTIRWVLISTSDQSTKMKKILQYTLLGFALTFSSCRSELDKNPLSNYVNENFWTSESNTLLALTGVYRGNIQMTPAPATNAEFSPTDWWSYHGLIMLEVATDNA